MQTITFDRLKAFIHEAMVRLGLPDDDAMTVATLMAQADLQGSDGHGVSRLPQYARRIKAGGFNVRPKIRVVQEHLCHRAHQRRQRHGPSGDEPRR